MDHQDWASIAEDVGLELLGEPLYSKSHEIRWGSHGSWKLDREKGVFYSFELDKGFAVSEMLKHFDQDINATLQKYGLGAVERTPYTSLHRSSAAPLTRDQLAELWIQATVKIKYSDNFIVLRFPDGHKLSFQKYHPYSFKDGGWIKKRPEGKLPLYLTPDRDTTKPLLIVEGEKAAMAAEQIYSGQVCCHHGGAKGWDKTDWSIIYGREVYIYPDNDDVGFDFADKISKHLQLKGCTTHIAKPHEELGDKEDLHEALEKGLYESSEELVEDILANKIKRPMGSFYFESVDAVMEQVDEPDWLIEKVVEKASVTSIYGAPKSGKSFVAIAMAAAIGKGSDFYGYKAHQAPVLYCGGEGRRGIMRRLAAYSQAKEELSGSPIFISNRGARVLEDDEYEALIAEIQLLEAQKGKLGMIIFDTLNRNWGSGNENSTEDMTRFIGRLDNLVHRFGMAVCVVHHSGHGTSARARGSSVLQASIDYEYKVTRNDVSDKMFVTLDQSMNKDGMGMTSLNFEFTEIELLGFKDLKSGFLSLTDVVPKAERASQELDDAHEALKAYQINKNVQHPVTVWAWAADLVGSIKKPDGTDLSRKGIDYRLKKLAEKDLIRYEAENGYQVKDFDNADIF